MYWIWWYQQETELILTRFTGTSRTLRFNEKSFLTGLLGFTRYWDYKPIFAFHADSPDVYTSEKSLNLCNLDELHLKRDCNDESEING